MHNRTWLYLFAGAWLTNLLALSFGAEILQWFSKPLLLAFLYCYIYFQSLSPRQQKNWLLAALLFSWLGDLFLLAESKYPFLFIPGLLSFLIAHLCLIRLFLLFNGRASPSAGEKAAGIFILAYASLLSALLFPRLGPLKIPVLFYAAILSMMWFCAIRAGLRTKARGRSSWMAGASLFVLSDSLLAIDRFYHSFENAGLAVMLSYGAAQFLISTGAARRLRTANNY